MLICLVRYLDTKQLISSGILFLQLWHPAALERQLYFNVNKKELRNFEYATQLYSSVNTQINFRSEGDL